MLSCTSPSTLSLSPLRLLSWLAAAVQNLWELAAVVLAGDAAPPATSGMQHWRHVQRSLRSSAAKQQLELSNGKVGAGLVHHVRALAARPLG